jgi:hypothetical protein
VRPLHTAGKRIRVAIATFAPEVPRAEHSAQIATSRSRMGPTSCKGCNGRLQSVTRKDSGGGQVAKTTYAYGSHGRVYALTDAGKVICKTEHLPAPTLRQAGKTRGQRREALGPACRSARRRRERPAKAGRRSTR